MQSRTYPRIRKTIKWTSAVMAVVLMVAWAVSLLAPTVIGSMAGS